MNTLTDLNVNTIAKRVGRAVTLATLAVASTVLAAMPSQAAAEWDACPTGAFCVWEGPEATGRMVYYRTGSFNVADQGLSGGGRSGLNNTGSKWCYNHTSGRLAFVPGMYHIADPGARLNNLAIWALHRPEPARCITEIPELPIPGRR